MRRKWHLKGVPFDSSGIYPGDTPQGMAFAPRALRRAGIVAALGAGDYADMDVAMEGTERNAANGILGYGSVCDLTDEVHRTVMRMLGAGGFPFLIGGCDAFLPAAVVGVQDYNNDDVVGLAYVAGRLALHTETSSLTGRFADMAVSSMLGYGQQSWQIIHSSHLSGWRSWDIETWQKRGRASLSFLKMSTRSLITMQK
jgi:arginase